MILQANRTTNSNGKVRRFYPNWMHIPCVPKRVAYIFPRVFAINAMWGNWWLLVFYFYLVLCLLRPSEAHSTVGVSALEKWVGKHLWLSMLKTHTSIAAESRVKILHSNHHIDAHVEWDAKVQAVRNDSRHIYMQYMQYILQYHYNRNNFKIIMKILHILLMAYESLRAYACKIS